MSARARQMFVWSLVAGLVLLNGLVYPQTVAHAAHHAHHTAATHATVLCTWMCASGQALQGIAVIFDSDLHPFTHLTRSAAQRWATGGRSATASRGPPSFSV